MTFDLRYTPFYAESWNVAFRRKPQGAVLTDRQTPFAVIPNPMRYWAADPMIFSHEGKTYLFAELYDYILYRGVIGVCEYRDSKFTPWKPIIREDFHMSYPYVFRLGDEICMIPETTQRDALLVYRAVDFPLRWELHKVIREGVCWADTSIVSDGDGFLGHTQAYDKQGTAELVLRLDRELNLIGQTINPNADPKTSRPGGRPFCLDGLLWRVCQDCRDGYGKALYFRSDAGEIHLAPQELNFSKKILLDGMHTYSATEEFEVIDLKTLRLNPLNLFMRIVRKLRR